MPSDAAMKAAREALPCCRYGPEGECSRFDDPDIGCEACCALRAVAAAIDAAVEAEREACAAVCEDQAQKQVENANPIAAAWAASGCARAIRARSKP